MWKDIGVVAGAMVSVCVLIGLSVRFVLVPYLEKNVLNPILKPVQETHRQVTQNRHANPEPTVLDRIDDVHDEVKRLADTTVAVQAIANAAARSAGGAHRRLDSHVNWADHEVSRLWQSLSTPPAHRARDADREDRD